MSQFNQDRSSNPDTVLVVDAYRRKVCADAAHTKIDADREAADLVRLIRATARHPRLVAITEAHDRAAQKAYADAGFQVTTLNGDRDQALPRIVARTAETIRLDRPRRLILVTNDRSFHGLARSASQRNCEVLVWWSGDLPPELRQADYIVRDLERDVLNLHQRRPIVSVYIDYENIHIGLERQHGRSPLVHEILKAVSAEACDLGQIGDIHAYGDWKRLSDTAGVDIQRKLAEFGVKTHYQINGFGKNCADTVIIEDVHTALDLCASGARTIDAFVLVTGDRDFAELVERVQLTDKRLRVLSLRNVLSRRLAQAASDIHYLDSYFGSDSRSADGRQTRWS